jgi:hypothetical protein
MQERNSTEVYIHYWAFFPTHKFPKSGFNCTSSGQQTTKNGNFLSLLLAYKLIIKPISLELGSKRWRISCSPNWLIDLGTVAQARPALLIALGINLGYRRG